MVGRARFEGGPVYPRWQSAVTQDAYGAFHGTVYRIESPAHLKHAWTCDHEHPDRATALACASTERNRLELPPVQIGDSCELLP